MRARSNAGIVSILSFSLIGWLPVPAVYGAAPLCIQNAAGFPLPNGLEDIIGAANQSSKDEFSKKSIKDFCIETARAKMEEVFFTSEDGGRTRVPIKSQSELEKIIKDHPDKLVPDWWMMGNYPDLNLKKTAYELKFDVDAPNKSHSQKKEMIRAFLNDPKNGRFEGEEYLLGPARANPTDILKNKPIQENDVTQTSAAFRILCASYTLKHYSGCVQALQEILSTYMPHVEGGNNVDLPLIAKVLTDPTYAPGAAKAALKIMDRVENKDLSGDLMGDVVQGYRDTGLSEEKAREHAWDLIQVWATRGPNLYSLADYINKDSVHTYVALDVISGALPYLDQLRIDAGKNPYSYPPEIKTTCTYGKPYHFWMAACLAKKLGEKTGSSEGAMYASYLAEIGYQMKSQTSGRDPNRAFMVDNFDPANNKLRVDVAFGAAGAVYGMKSASDDKAHSMSIDSALTNMIKDSKSEPTLNKTDAEKQWSGTGAEGYFRWKSIIAPDSALDYYLDQ